VGVSRVDNDEQDEKDASIPLRRSFAHLISKVSRNQSTDEACGVGDSDEVGREVAETNPTSSNVEEADEKGDRKRESRRRRVKMASREDRAHERGV